MLLSMEGTIKTFMMLGRAFGFQVARPLRQRLYSKKNKMEKKEHKFHMINSHILGFFSEIKPLYNPS